MMALAALGKHRQADRRQGAKHRQSSDGPVLFWGIHPVLEALRVRPHDVHEIYLHKQKAGAKCAEIIRLAQLHQVKLHPDPELFARKIRKASLEQAVHQGVLAIGNPFAAVTLAELLARVATPPPACLAPSVLLALDNIQDPHNMGAIVRTGFAAGVAGIVVPKDRSAPLNGTVVKASAGALLHVDICRVANLVAALQQMKREGVWLFGTVKDAPASLYQADFSTPVCIVIGGEEKGLRPLVREQCDFLVSIPMRPGIDSLNAATAAAIVLFEIFRQRIRK